jgi:predicted phage terminase large subunit-like protein
VYGEEVYIEDVVFNNGLPEVTKELVANALVNHKVNRTDVEMNNGGNYYAEGVNELVKEKGGNTTFRLFFTSNNKVVKIISMSDFVKKRFLFKDPSTYSPNSVYAKFMQQVHGWTQTGKNKHDDAVDTLAMLAQLVQDLEGSSIKIVKRSVLGL